MDQVIDKAVKESNKRPREKEVDKHKKKKSKHSHEKEATVDIPVNHNETDENFLIAKKELKNLMLKYPNIEVDKVEKVTNAISALSPNDVAATLENLKISIGLESPTHTSENVVGTIGVILQRLMKNNSIYHKLMDDERLLAAVEQMCPVISDYLNTPLQIVHRLAIHISEAQFGEKEIKK